MGLIHWWPFSANNDLIDYGSKKINISNTGCTFEASGKVGSHAIKTLGTSSGYLNTNRPCNQEFTNNQDFSFALWLKSTSRPTTNGTGLIANNQYNGGGIGFCTLTDGKVSIFLNGSLTSQQLQASNTVVPLNEWHHVACTYHNQTYKIYLDGKVDALGTVQYPWTTNTTTTLIGTGSQGGWAYGGTHYLNDVRIYDHCLTPLEVAEIARAKILHYPLDNNGWGARLPSGYQLVEYLESTGTLWIDTGIGGFLQAIQDVEFNTSITTRLLMGLSSSDPYWGRAANGKFELNGSVVTLCIMATNRHKIVYTVDTVHHSSLLIDDDELIEQNKTNNLTYSFNYHLFHINGFNGLQSSVKLWYCKIVQNNRLVFHGIPCYRKSDGKPGLYDLVSNTFLTNSGSGEFLLGPSVGLPADYLLVEYIETINTESTGFQYVSLNTTWALAKTIQQIAEVVKYSNGNHCMLYRNNALTSLWFSLDSTNGYSKGGRTGITLTSTALTWLNNKVYVSMTATSTSTYKFEVGAWSDVTWSGAWRNYSTRIFNTAAVCDLIPCYRKSDGKPGMYDVINNVFYTNAGSGEFKVGERKYLAIEKAIPRKTNQLFKETAVRKDTGYGITYGVSPITLIYYCKGTALSWSGQYATFYPNFGSGITSITNHIYAFILKPLSIAKNDITLSGILGITSTALYSNYNKILIFKATNAANMRPYVNVRQWAAGKEYDVTFKVAMVDLTDMFGTGNEPTSLAAVLAQCPWILECEDYAALGSTHLEPFEEVVYPPIAQRTIEYDISGYGRNGTVTDRVMCDDSLRYYASLNISGNTNIKYLSPTTSTALTLSLWVKPLVNSGNMIFFVDYLSKLAAGFVSGISSFITSCQSLTPVVTMTNITLNTWYHFVIVKNGSSTILYKNGVLLTNDSSSNSWTHEENSIMIGSRITAAGYNSDCNACISDVRLYATVLSADDVMKLYHGEI